MSSPFEQVKKCYSSWSTTYYNDYYKNASYPPVHVDLLKKLIDKYNPSDLLDAGCGPASFLREIFQQKANLYGFDLTPEMITEAKNVFRENGLCEDNLWEGSVTDATHFYPPNENDKKFDMCVCLGVLPHITEESDEQVLANIHGALNPGGVAVVEARNELFGLFTMNRYSFDVLKNDLMQLDKLKENATAQESEALDKISQEMQKYFRMDLPPIRTNKDSDTGYDKILSRTHNPFVLKEQMVKAGFHDVELLFYHFHCLPPMFANMLPEFFHKESLKMEENPSDWKGHFMASAFVVTGKK